MKYVKLDIHKHVIQWSARPYFMCACKLVHMTRPFCNPARESSRTSCLKGRKKCVEFG